MLVQGRRCWRGELRGGAVLQLHTPSAQHHLPILLPHITCLNHSPSEGGPLWEGADTRWVNSREGEDGCSKHGAKGIPDICFSVPPFPCLPRWLGASLLPPLPRHRGLFKVWDIHPADLSYSEGKGSLQPSLPKDHFRAAHGHLTAFSAPSPVFFTPHHTSPPRKRSLFLITEK